MRVRNADVGGVEVGQQADEQVRARRPSGAEIAPMAARASGARSIAASASCRPSGQPSVSSCSRARRRRRRARRSARAPARSSRRAGSAAPARRPARIAVGDQVVDVEVAVVPRGDHHAQVRRRVAQQVREDARTRRGRQALGLVDDQHDVERGLRHLGEPDGDALQRVGGRAPSSSVWPKVGRPRPRRTASARPCTKRRRVVGRLRRQPGDDRAAREVLAPPLRQQRGLAEAGRRLHHDDRAVAELRVAGGEPLADDEVPRRPRRGGLEDQLGGRAARARLCGVRHDSDPGKVAPAGGSLRPPRRRHPSHSSHRTESAAASRLAGPPEPSRAVGCRPALRSAKPSGE